jgi:hypothetical protein
VKIVASDRARRYIAERGGKVWVWLDPHRGLVGSYVWLEAHAEPPRSSRTSSFTRSSRRGHRFRVFEGDGLEVHADFGRLEPPGELHLDLRGWVNKRIEAYWNGSVFAGPDVPPPEP